MNETGNIDDADLKSLKKRVNCSVTTQEDKEYDEQRMPWLEVVEQLPSGTSSVAHLRENVNASELQISLESLRN